MPRLSKQEIQKRDDVQRFVINNRPKTVVQGGFAWLPLLAALGAAGATPLIGKAGSWLGEKIFGKGIQRPGERIQIRPVPMPAPPIQLRGSGMSKYRSGDYPMPSMVPIPHVKSQTTGGLPGAGWNPLSGFAPDLVKAIGAPAMKVKKAICGSGKCKGGKVKKGSAAMKAKMAALRAMKSAAPGGAKKKT